MAVRFGTMITVTGRWIGRLVIGALSLALALFILFDLTLAAGMVWLNSPGGQDWARPKLAAMVEGDGYTLSYHTLVYSISNGLTLTGFRLGDADGAIAEIDYAALRVNILSLAARRIALGLDAHRMVLHRLPPASDRAVDTPDENQTAFNPDDFFLNTIILNRLSVDHLELRQPVMGQAMILSPTVSGRVSLTRKIAVMLNGRIDQNHLLQVTWMPRRLMLDASLDMAEMRGALSRLFVHADAYQLEGKGNLALGDAGDNDLRLILESRDLSLLVPGDTGEGKLSAHLSGPAQDPAIEVSGRVVLGSLVDKGLPEILLAANAASLRSDPAGRISLSGVYRDMDVSVSTLFTYANPVVTLSAITLTGPDLTGAGEVEFDHSTTLATGELAIQADNLASYAPLLAQDIAGRAGLELALTAPDQRQQLSAQLNLENARYQSNTVGRADLTAMIGDVKNPWPQNLDLNLRNLSVGRDLKIASLTTQLKEADNHDYALTMAAQGQFNRPFTLKGEAMLGDVNAAMPRISGLDLTLQSGGAAVTLAGDYTAEQINMILSARDLDPNVLTDDLPDAIRAMRLTGKATVTGSPAAPQIDAEFSSSPVSLAQNAPRLTLSATGRYAEGRATIKMDGRGNGIRSLSAEAALPLTLSLQPFAAALDNDAGLTGTLDADLNGGVLADMILPPDHRFSGDLRGSGTLSGTVARPDLQAVLTLRDGVYDYAPYEIGLRDIALDASVTRDQISLTRLTATDGAQGRLQGGGVINLTRQQDTRVTVSLDDFHIAKSVTANGRAGADLTLTGREDGYLIGGAARLGQFDIVIPEQFRSNIPQLNIVEAETGAEAPLQTIALDIELHAPNRIFVRGWGLDAEFGGNLDITGTLDAPQVNGEFESLRGRYEEFGRRFSLAHAKLRFQGSVPPSPYLDIEATTVLDDVAASVLLTGPVTNPGIKLSAVPSLPEDEVMSHILFGKTMNRITPFQAIQLTQTLQRFSGQGGGGFDPLGRLRSMTGLDDIRVDTSESGESSVGVGKYLTDKVYLEVEKGHGEASGAANLQIEITPSISLESKIGQDAQGGAGVFWSRDY